MLSLRKILAATQVQASFLAILGFLLSTLFFGLFEAHQIEFVVKATINHGKFARVYFNEDYVSPAVETIVEGKANEYRFRKKVDFLSAIRLDPTDAKGAKVVLHSVSLVNHGRVIESYMPSEIAAWGAHGMRLESFSKSGGVTFATDSPALIVNLKSRLDSSLPKFLIGRKPMLGTYAVALLFLSILLVGLFDRKFPAVLGAFPLVIGIAFYLLWPLCTQWILRWEGTPPSVDQSVGYLAWGGISNNTTYWAYFVSLFLMGILGVSLAYIYLGWMARKRLPLPSELVNRVPVSYAFPISLLGFLAVFTVPNIAANFSSLAGVRHAMDFDSSNLLTWLYMVQKGWLPFRDFWFPYGGRINQLGSFPWAMVNSYVSQLVLASVLLFAVFAWSQRSRIWVAIGFVSMILLYQAGSMGAVDRYFLPLGILLFPLGLDKEPRSDWVGYCFYGLYLFWVFYLEPNQLAYALPALILVIGFRSIQSRSLFDAKRLGLSFGVLLVCTGLYLIFVLGLSGQLPQFINFYSNLGALATYGGSPPNASDWYQPGLRSSQLLYFLSHVFVGYGAFLLCMPKQKAGFGLATAIFGIGVLGSVLGLKQILRSDISLQLIGVLYFGLLLYLCYSSQYWSFFQKRTAWFLMGVLLAVNTQNGVLPRLWASSRGLPEVPTQISMSLGVLEKPHSELYTVFDRFFSLSSFSCGNCHDVVSYLSQRMGEGSDQIFVLGDDSFFYILLGQKPPRYVTFYDASWIVAQREVTSWLESKQPKWVIWNPSSSHFDTVPNIVRNPFIFDFVIRNYRWDSSFGEFEVLHLKTAPERGFSASDLQFWTKKLGNTVELGSVPGLSRSSAERPCRATDENCEDILIVHLAPSENSVNDQKSRSIFFRVGEELFLAKFAVKEGLKDYTFVLDRLWFWGPLKKMGVPVSIDEAQAEGVKLDLKRLSLQKDRLY